MATYADDIPSSVTYLNFFFNILEEVGKGLEIRMCHKAEFI